MACESEGSVLPPIDEPPLSLRMYCESESLSHVQQEYALDFRLLLQNLISKVSELQTEKRVAARSVADKSTCTEPESMLSAILSQPPCSQSDNSDPQHAATGPSANDATVYNQTDTSAIISNTQQQQQQNQQPLFQNQRHGDYQHVSDTADVVCQPSDQPSLISGDLIGPSVDRSETGIHHLTFGVARKRGRKAKKKRAKHLQQNKELERVIGATGRGCEVSTSNVEVVPTQSLAQTVIGLEPDAGESYITDYVEPSTPPGLAMSVVKRITLPLGKQLEVFLLTLPVDTYTARICNLPPLTPQTAADTPKPPVEPQLWPPSLQISVRSWCLVKLLAAACGSGEAGAGKTRVNKEARAILDNNVRGMLRLSREQFLYRLFELGLLRSKQRCRRPYSDHHVMCLVQFLDQTLLDNCAGYAWLCRQCYSETSTLDISTISIFHGSIFDSAPAASKHSRLHADSSIGAAAAAVPTAAAVSRDKNGLYAPLASPVSLVKLLYHWSCQTPVHLVLSWLQVSVSVTDRVFSLLRSVVAAAANISCVPQPLFGSTVSQSGDEEEEEDGSKLPVVRLECICMGPMLKLPHEKTPNKMLNVFGVVDCTSGDCRLIANTLTPTSRQLSDSLLAYVTPSCHLVLSASVPDSYRSVLSLTFKKLTVEPHHHQQGTAPITASFSHYMHVSLPRMFKGQLGKLTVKTVRNVIGELNWRQCRGTDPNKCFTNLLSQLSVLTHTSDDSLFDAVKQLSGPRSAHCKKKYLQETASTSETAGATSPVVTSASSSIAVTSLTAPVVSHNDNVSTRTPTTSHTRTTTSRVDSSACDVTPATSAVPLHGGSVCLSTTSSSTPSRHHHNTDTAHSVPSRRLTQGQTPEIGHPVVNERSLIADRLHSTCSSSDLRVDGVALYNSFYSQQRYESVVFAGALLPNHNCIECGGRLNSEQHRELLVCKLCRFSSCCAVACLAHVRRLHSESRNGGSRPIHGTLSRPLTCTCGFSTPNGDNMAEHKTECEYGVVFCSPDCRPLKRELDDTGGVYSGDASINRSSFSSVPMVTVHSSANSLLNTPVSR